MRFHKESKQIHIAVDAVGIKHSGTAVVLLDFLEAACSDPRISKITLFCSPRKTRNFDVPKSGKILELPQSLAERSYLFRVFWYEMLAKTKFLASGAHVSLAFGSMGKGNKAIPSVTFVQQSLPFSTEAIRTHTVTGRIYIKIIELMMRRSCKSAATVITQSPVMAELVSKLFLIARNRIVPILPGMRYLPPVTSESPKLESLRRSKSGARILYVGNRSPYKNLKLAVAAMPLLIEKVGAKASLFLTLPQNALHPAEKEVLFLGHLVGSELTEAYQLANILLLPSLIETVGLPTLEAMSVGTPVLVADRPYAHSICEDAALFFDPLSPEDMAQKAAMLLSDEELRKNLIHKGYALIERRIAAKPYRQMVDILVNVANCSISESFQ